MPPLIQARPSNPMQSSLASHEWLWTHRLDACPKREAAVERHTADGMERRLSRGNSYWSMAAEETSGRQGAKPCHRSERRLGGETRT